MKKLYTRALALFLALLFILTTSFTAFAATEAKTTKNYGNRDTVCTSLSDQAEDYYADNNALYSELDDLSHWQKQMAASTRRCPLVFLTCCLSDRTLGPPLRNAIYLLLGSRQN